MDAKEEMELDDWKKLKLPKEMTVIKVSKPEGKSKSIRGSQVEKEDVEENPREYPESFQKGASTSQVL